jgi:hypothetical protein
MLAGKATTMALFYSKGLSDAVRWCRESPLFRFTIRDVLWVALNDESARRLAHLAKQSL